jgi:hypothetical protein
LAKKISQKKKGRRESKTKKTTVSIAKVAETVQKRIPSKLPLEEVRKQLLSYASQIEDYLGNVDAKVDNFKFSVEMGDNSLTIDAVFKATIST